MASGTESRDRFLQLAIGLVEKEIGKKQYVLPSFAQARHIDGKLVDAVVQIFPEGAGGDSGLQIFVGGSYQPHIDLDVGSHTYGLDPTLLQYPQQLYLHIVTEVTYLVKKYRTAVGLDKGPHLIFDGSGKRTFLMPEKFGGGQLLGNSPAVDGYKRFVGSLAQLVYALGHILFAGTACPVYQHRHVGGGHQFHVGVELAGGFALPFEERGLFVPPARPDSFATGFAGLAAVSAAPRASLIFCNKSSGLTGLAT